MKAYSVLLAELRAGKSVPEALRKVKGVPGVRRDIKQAILLDVVDPRDVYDTWDLKVKEGIIDAILVALGSERIVAEISRRQGLAEAERAR